MCLKSGAPYLFGPALHGAVAVDPVVFEHLLEEEGVEEVGREPRRVGGAERVVALLQEPHVGVNGLVEEPSAAHTKRDEGA